mgnify:CR=1 FL=1
MSEWDAYSLEELEQSKKEFSGLGMDTTIQAIDAAIANKEKGLGDISKIYDGEVIFSDELMVVDVGNTAH